MREEKKKKRKIFSSTCSSITQPLKGGFSIIFSGVVQASLFLKCVVPHEQWEKRKKFYSYLTAITLDKQ
jgi:hypothetical protein